MKKLLTIFAVTIFLSIAPPAKADTVTTLTLTNCGTAGTTCPAATYTLTIHPTGGSGYDITLSITITGAVTSGGFTGSGGNDHIAGVSVKIASDILNPSLISGPAGATWLAAVEGQAGDVSNQSGGDCQGSGSGWVCTTVAAGNAGLLITQGGTYDWKFHVDNGGALVSAPSIQVNYDPHNGLIVSQTLQVPEPGTMILLGFGLLGLGTTVLRRRLL